MREDTKGDMITSRAKDMKSFIVMDVMERAQQMEHQGQEVIHLESREVAVITADDVRFLTLEGVSVPKEVCHIPWDPVSAVKGPHRHFMQKEIYEQAQAVTHTISSRVDFELRRVYLEELNLTAEQAQEIERIVIVASASIRNLPTWAA